jgi:hypothetical protein
MRLAAPEAAASGRGRGRGPAEPAPGAGRRVPLVGAPERADDAVDLRRGQRVSAAATPKSLSALFLSGDTQENYHLIISHTLVGWMPPTHSKPCALFVCLMSVRYYASEDPDVSDGMQITGSIAICAML